MAPREEEEKKRSQTKSIICGVLDDLCPQELDKLFIAISDRDSFKDKLNSWINSLSRPRRQDQENNIKESENGPREQLPSSRGHSDGLCPIQSKRFCEEKGGIKDFANNMAHEFLIIKHDMMEMLPFSQDVNHITKPIGDGKTEMPEVTLNIDAFLYNDEDIDSLTDRGLLSRSFCADCKSLNTQPISFISHSMSMLQMAFLFHVGIPQIVKDTENKAILDVGSRIGAVLFGAYKNTKLKEIIGVEIEKELCEIQREITKKNGMDDRIKIIEADINNCRSDIESADIVILHNVFEYFMPKPEQSKTWLFLRDSIQCGTIVVTVPSIEESINFDEDLVSKMNVTEWLKPLNIDYGEDETLDEDDLSEIQSMYFYETL